MQRCCPAYCELARGDLRTIQPRGELPLLERPFVLGHFDCWGLVELFRQTRDSRLPGGLSVGKRLPGQFLSSAGTSADSGSLMVPQEGDLVIMQVQADKWNHAGILLEVTCCCTIFTGHLVNVFLMADTGRSAQ
ncbi:hypothetical protein BANRA_05489 [Escherichia coli]|nr:hypothetical protein BANRA_05489 [Escherichia coli]